MSTDTKATVIILPALNAAVKAGLADSCRLLEMEASDIRHLPSDVAQTVRAVVCVGSFDTADIDRLPNLELIASFGVGYDGIDIRHAAARGIVVTNTPDVVTEEVADAAIGLLINCVRGFARAETWLRAGHWERDRSYPLSTLTLRGRSVGIFGLGRIGRAIAKRVEAFGLPVAYHNRQAVDDVPYRYCPCLMELARSVDTLIAVVPGGASTDKIIGTEVFKALGDRGVFINVGRGTTVDEEALIAALRDRTIAAAGLDVFASEPVVSPALLALETATVLPHIAAATVDARAAVSQLVVDNVVRWFEERRPLTPVKA